MTIEKSSMKCVRVVLGFLLGAAVFLSAGCSENDGEQGVSTKSVANEIQVSKEEQVKQRILARWNALIDLDWDAAYSFFSKGSRELVSKEVFTNQMKTAPLIRRGAKIVSLECQQDVCDARIEHTYIYMGGVEAMRGQQTSSIVKEKWIFSDGNWWYSAVGAQGFL